MPDRKKVGLTQELVIKLLQNSDYSISKISSIAQVARSTVYRLADQVLGPQFLEQRARQLEEKKIKDGLLKAAGQAQPAAASGADDDAVQIIDLPPSAVKEEPAAAESLPPKPEGAAAAKQEPQLQPKESAAAEQAADAAQGREFSEEEICSLLPQQIAALHPALSGVWRRRVFAATYRGRTRDKYADIIQLIEELTAERGCRPPMQEVLGLIQEEDKGVSLSSLTAVFQLLNRGFRLSAQKHLIIPTKEETKQALMQLTQYGDIRCRSSAHNTESHRVQIKYGELEISWDEPDSGRRLDGILRILSELNLGGKEA